MENPFNTEQNNPKRSTLLTVFLVLTFIGSGLLSFLPNTLIALFFEQAKEMFENIALDYDMEAAFKPLMNAMENTGIWGYGFSAILALVSLVGAVLMWNLNQRGFHLYASANIISLFVPMLFGIASFPSIFWTLITALFIWVYARELKIFAKPVKE